MSGPAGGSGQPGRGTPGYIWPGTARPSSASLACCAAARSVLGINELPGET
jgi:hypothetical protein